jgi:hypothetical protein
MDCSSLRHWLPSSTGPAEFVNDANLADDAGCGRRFHSSDLVVEDSDTFASLAGGRKGAAPETGAAPGSSICA